MNIISARRLKNGDRVHYPKDRGEPGGIGTVIGDAHRTSAECINIHGEKYIWVHVRMKTRRAIWPSNRLG